MTPPDPKQGPRIVDPKATTRAVLLHPCCAACGRPASNGHHVIRKGAPYLGDDVVENVVGLCGSGTTRCHGAHHGSPYLVDVTSLGHTLVERRDAEWVNRRIGLHIDRERPDVIAYVLGKLGNDAGREYLRRVYFLEVM